MRRELQAKVDWSVEGVEGGDDDDDEPQADPRTLLLWHDCVHACQAFIRASSCPAGSHRGRLFVSGRSSSRRGSSRRKRTGDMHHMTRHRVSSVGQLVNILVREQLGGKGNTTLRPWSVMDARRRTHSVCIVLGSEPPGASR